MESFRDTIGLVGLAVEGVGVLVIVTGLLVATARFAFHRQPSRRLSYQAYRQDVARAILLGLEFLIAGDIIHTVAVQPTLQNVGILGLIVLIRTFLSIALHLEVEGRWPWQDDPEDQPIALSPGRETIARESGER